jgi:hypothetical protein
VKSTVTLPAFAVAWFVVNASWSSNAPRLTAPAVLAPALELDGRDEQPDTRGQLADANCLGRSSVHHRCSFRLGLSPVNQLISER